MQTIIGNDPVTPNCTSSYEKYIKSLPIEFFNSKPLSFCEFIMKKPEGARPNVFTHSFFNQNEVSEVSV